MNKWEFAPPSDLAAFELEVDGELFVLFEWSSNTTEDASKVGIILSNLTPAERAVAEALLCGCSNAAIAAKRRTRPRTVANQVASVYRKLGVNSRFELVALLTGRDP